MVMGKHWLRVAGVAFVVALTGRENAHATPRPVEGNAVAITNVTVLPMTGPERLQRRTVLIRDGRIVSVSARGQTPISPGTRVIDGTGKYLMPGLVDMHVHIAPTTGEEGDSAQRALAVMLAHGVTAARSMVGAPNNRVVRGKVEAGTLAGPRLYLAAPFFTDTNTPNAEAARTAVAKAKTDGFDFVKFVSVSARPTFDAVQAAARDAKLGVGGHVSNAIGTQAAAAAGQQIEHLDGMLSALLPTGSRPSQPFGQFPPREVLRSLSNVSDAQIEAFARGLPRTWHVPTLSLFEKLMDVSQSSETLRRAPEMRYVAPFVLDQWVIQRAAFQEVGYTPADAKLFIDLRRRLVRALNRANAPLMAGSDTAQSFHLWGPALHAEIRSLASTGLSPMQALKSATIVPRDYFRSLPNSGSALGWAADFGTVEAGARADLILLASDPSRDLKALQRPEVVFAAGRIYDRVALDAMLDAAAIAAAKAVPPPPAR